MQKSYDKALNDFAEALYYDKNSKSMNLFIAKIYVEQGYYSRAKQVGCIV